MIMRHFSDMFALASAVALSVISCAKESEDHVNDGTKNKITITASLPDPDFGNDSPYLFTPMYEASFKGTKR